MKLERAKRIAEKCKKLLESSCVKILVAGSVRREKVNPGDVELVVQVKDLEKFIKQVNKWQRVRGSPEGRYTQRIVDGEKVDIFIARPDGTNFGNIAVFRTGNRFFSQWIAGVRPEEVGLRHEDGYLWNGDKKIICREEKDVFRVLKVPFIPPIKREYLKEDVWK